jgi:hypothetical protein
MSFNGTASCRGIVVNDGMNAWPKADMTAETLHENVL